MVGVFDGLPSFARWPISDPLQYLLRLRDERSAQSRLDDILGSETRNTVAKHELIEIIRTTKDRVRLCDALLTDAKRTLNRVKVAELDRMTRRKPAARGRTTNAFNTLAGEQLQ